MKAKENKKNDTGGAIIAASSEKLVRRQIWGGLGWVDNVLDSVTG